MISVPTVFVLGAGASAHLGYPLGTELVEQIKEIGRDPVYRNFPDGRLTQAEMLSRTLERADASSIDSFLAANPSLLETGKFLIAVALKRYELPEKIFPRGSGWYSILANAMLAKNLGEIENNHLTVVTFNYDRSLEFFLFEKLKNFYVDDCSAAADAFKKIRIIHVHGILGAFPDVGYQVGESPEALYQISQQIKVISEFGSAALDDMSQFSEAARWTAQANRVYFLGFGFHEDNMRRLWLSGGPHCPEQFVRATSCKMGTIDRDRVVRLCSALDIPSPSAVPIDGALSCEDFLREKAILD